MARRTEGVTERLIAAARDEFLEKGFENASLRTIAQRAQSSTGAIYVRYSDKEDLFGAVVDPATDGLCAFFTSELDGYLGLSDEEQRRHAKLSPRAAWRPSSITSSTIKPSSRSSSLPAVLATSGSSVVWWV